MTIKDIISNLHTTPFLFIGSGMSRRYLNLPDWKGLLKHFAEIVKNDPFAYSSYENKVKKMDYKSGILPKIAELIQKDFDEKWFSDTSIRTVDENILEQIKNGLSPFKAEIAQYIKEIATINTDYQNEIDKLSKISEKNIAGVITTNYDSFLEDHFLGFTKYIGQTQLIFSSIQGVAEIYKIHGSVESPDSIVINEEDYLDFENKSAYLVAKLMTIFVEYPIIFMGYSISDNNIINIIRSIVNCLNEEQIKLLENRFVFVEYKENMKGIEVAHHSTVVDNKSLNMTKIVLSDFMPLYNAMESKQSKLPVKILRKFKQELYSYTLTNTPTTHLRVASIDDTRVDDDDLVLAIGRVSELGLRGLSGIDGNDWYRNIILDDIEFSADELLEYAFPKLLKQNSSRLPVNKYLQEATRVFPECISLSKSLTFDSFIPTSIKNNKRNCLGEYRSIKQIWDKEKSSIERSTRLISHLKEEAFNILELEMVLNELFQKDKNILQKVTSTERSNIKRLILIYDYLKWGKKKEVSN